MEQVKKQHEHQEEPDLRGTAYFVGTLGALMAIGLLGVFYLFTSRGLTFLVM